MSFKSDFSSLTINAKSHNYEVVIGAGALYELKNFKDLVVVADARFKGLLEKSGVTRCVLIEAFESNKTLITVENIITELQTHGVRADSTVVAIGGGIIQDLMTMAASIYMRGISWIYAPTTLLGMTDSCIGGKSSINTKFVKNLIGNIFPPKKVVIDTDFVRTLSDEDFACGLAEASKICFCKGGEEFKKFIELSDGQSPEEVTHMLEHVLKSKKWFIEIDEFDRSERKHLNFGHSFGHALEVGSSHKIPHGLAVASGIKSAIFFESISRDLSAIESELFSYENKLLGRLKDRVMAEHVDWEKYRDAFNADKKHSQYLYSLVLPKFGGGVRLEKFDKSEIMLERVVDAQKSSLSDKSI